MRHLFVLFLLFFCKNSNGFQCPEVGLRFKTKVLDDSKNFEPGWQYWKQCSERCQANPECKFWTMFWDSRFSDSKNRVHCQLFAKGNDFDRPTNQPYTVFYSGKRNCKWIEPTPPETVSFD